MTLFETDPNNLIRTSELTLSDVPTADDAWRKLVSFAETFDPIEEHPMIAMARLRDCGPDSSTETLRSGLLHERLRVEREENGQPGDETLTLVKLAVEEIRKRLITQ